MTNPNWYRQSTWTPEIAAEFERRLARARGQRGEYLRIQALSLADTGNPAVTLDAVNLARRFLELQETGLGVAQMHATVAKAFATLGDTASAVAAYRLAVDAESTQPNVRGCHYIDFAWFAASTRLSACYADVLAAISRNEADGDLVFPATRYRYFGALALIRAELGDAAGAKALAINALSAAAATTGPFPNRPHLGLATGRGTDPTHVRIRQLAD